MKGKLDNWLILPIIIFGSYFVIRLIDQAKLLKTFPLNYANDIAAYMASLFFLSKCGFNNFCPYWYNGFITFHTFSPGWQFFALPIYKLSGNILFTTYFSMILLFGLSFVFLFILGKNSGFSKTKIVAFFFILFGNAISIGNLIRLGRMPTLFALTFFIALSAVILYYKDKRIDNMFFLLFIPIYFAVILSHQQEMALSQFLVISLLLAKRSFKDKIKIVVSVLIGLALSSFWWFPFLKNLSNNTLLLTVQGKWSLQFTGVQVSTNFISIVVPLLLLFIFYYYLKYKNKSNKELLFYIPIILLNILFLFRLTAFIPILNSISQDPYIIFFLFFILYLFLKINFSYYGRFVQKGFIFGLILIPILSVMISHFYTPYFIEYRQDEYDMLSILKQVDGKFYIFNTAVGTSHPKSYFAYGPIYYNISTISGFYPQIASQEYSGKLQKLHDSFNKKECDILKDSLISLGVEYVLAYDEGCKTLNLCRLSKKDKKGKACLYFIS